MSMSELRICKYYIEETSEQQAIRAYSGVSRITYTEHPEYWLLDFSNCTYGVGRTIREFENYLICIEATNGDNHGSV